MSLDIVKITIEINRYLNRKWVGENLPAYMRRIYGISSVEAETIKRLINVMNEKDVA